MADVKASVALSSDGRLQGFVGGSATNLGPIRIKTIQMQASAADAEVKIYDNTSAAGVIKIHHKFGTAANLVKKVKMVMKNLPKLPSNRNFGIVFFLVFLIYFLLFFYASLY